MLAADSGRLYPVVEGIAEFDLDTDIEEYDYDGRTVFRGNMDPDLSTDKQQVYWLYENDTRVGLVEHTSDAHKCYWYRSNVFSTLFQEDWTVYDETIWNILPQKAYDECMRHGWTTIPQVRARTHLALAMPSDFTEVSTSESPTICLRCADECKYSGCVPIPPADPLDGKSIFKVVFLDEDGTIYVPPSDTRAYTLYATLRRRGAAVAEADPAPAAAAAATTTGGGGAATTTDGGGVVSPAAAAAPSSS